MNFKEVDEHTEELIKVSSFLARVKGKDENVMKLLSDKYKEDITNYDNVLAMCFYQWFLADDKLNLADTNSVFQITFDVVNKIEDTLVEKPEYWILWILKYKIISFMNFNEGELITNLTELIHLQDIEPEKKQYFLVTEILLAHIYYSKNNISKSKAVLDKILERYSNKVIVLTNFFRGFTIEFINLLSRSGEEELLQLVNEILYRYF